MATLEQIARDAGHRLNALEDAYNGGGDVEYARSVRGRLHQLENAAAAAVLRRSMGMGLLKGWQQWLIVAAGIATAAAAWYAALHA